MNILIRRYPANMAYQRETSFPSLPLSQSFFSADQAISSTTSKSFVDRSLLIDRKNPIFSRVRSSREAASTATPAIWATTVALIGSAASTASAMGRSCSRAVSAAENRMRGGSFVSVCRPMYAFYCLLSTIDCMKPA